MSEKIIVNSSTGQKTIPNINPAATNAVCASLGSALNDLTDGTYQKTDRVFRVNCDTTPGGGAKPEPTLTLAESSKAVGELGNYATVITTNSDGQLYTRAYGTISSSTAPYWFPHCTIFTESSTGTKKLGIFINAENAVLPATVYVGVTESDNYAAKEVAFTITD